MALVRWLSVAEWDSGADGRPTEQEIQQKKVTDPDVGRPK